MADPEIHVGDLIQYRYTWGPRGFKQSALTTREIREIIEGGKAFIVDGGFRVEGFQVIAHFPIHRESVTSQQEQEADDEK